MADYGICVNERCELHYENFQDLLGWLNAHPNDNQKPPEPYLPVFQAFNLDSHCVHCQTVLMRATDPNKPPLANRFIEIVDLLRSRGVLEWP